MALASTDLFLCRYDELESLLTEKLLGTFQSWFVLGVVRSMVRLHLDHYFLIGTDQEEVGKISAEFSKVQRKRLVGDRRNLEV
ncbi:hypothetical protein LMG9673_04114 [Ralstonia pseudosolanacearum]|nr:hypothetical protein LMG9673_04114 [Ralstonia pseudosolanacearum]